MKTFSCVLTTFSLAALLSLGACKGDAPADGQDKSAEAADKAASGDAPDKTDGVPAPAEPAADLPEAKELLAKAVEAAGGKEKFDAVESFYQEGATVVKGQNINATVKLWWKNGDFYSESDMPGVGKIRAGKKGDVAWTDEPISGLRKLEGKEAAQAQWSSSLLLAGEWETYFDSAETVAKRDLNGTEVYDIKLVGKAGEELVMSLDAQTFLPVAQTFKQSGPMGETPITMHIKDYRDVDGMKLSFASVADAGLMELEQTVTKLELNVPVDESTFAMPTGGAEVVKAPMGTPLNELPPVPNTDKPRGPQPGDRP